MNNPPSHVHLTGRSSDHKPWVLSLLAFFEKHDINKFPVLQSDLVDALHVCSHLESCLLLDA